MYQLIKHRPNQEPWNKGKLVGQKLPLKLQEIWAIRIRLQVTDRFPENSSAYQWCLEMH